MNESEVLKAIRNIEGISDLDKERFTELIKTIFYTNPDDYYRFAEMTNELGADDQFFSHFSEYLQARYFIEEKVSYLIRERSLLKKNLSDLLRSSQDIESHLNEVFEVKLIISSIMEKFSNEEAMGFLKERELAMNKLAPFYEEIDVLDEAISIDKSIFRHGSNLWKRFLAYIRVKRNEGRKSNVTDAMDKTYRQYQARCNDVSHLFRVNVVDLPKRKFDLLVKYKDFGGYENAFTIKYDFNWFLHRGERGRLDDWLLNLGEEELRLREELEQARSLIYEADKRFRAKDDVIKHYDEHMELFGTEYDKRDIFAFYSSHYPNLSKYDLDDLIMLNEQSDAFVVTHYVPPINEKRLTLKKEKP